MTLSDLERLAREATPGPWKHYPWSIGGEGVDIPPRVDLASGRTVSFVGPVSARNEDAAFIAALDPDTVLALLRVVQAAVAWRHEHDTEQNGHRHAVALADAVDALAALNLKDET